MYWQNHNKAYLSAGQNIWNSSNHTKHQKPRTKIVDLNQPSHTRFINTYNIRWFVVSCQNVNTHAVSTQRSNAEQLPSCEWTAYEILSTIACSFFRLASMKKKYFVSRLQLSRGVISLMNLTRVRLVSILDLVMNRSNLRESPHYTFQGHLSFCIDRWSLLCFL